MITIECIASKKIWMDEKRFRNKTTRLPFVVHEIHISRKSFRIIHYNELLLRLQVHTCTWISVQVKVLLKNEQVTEKDYGVLVLVLRTRSSRRSSLYSLIRYFITKSTQKSSTSTSFTHECMKIVRGFRRIFFYALVRGPLAFYSEYSILVLYNARFRNEKTKEDCTCPLVKSTVLGARENTTAKPTWSKEECPVHSITSSVINFSSRYLWN